MAQTSPPILIVGAGIVGTTFAQCLRQVSSNIRFFDMSLDNIFVDYSGPFRTSSSNGMRHLMREIKGGAWDLPGYSTASCLSYLRTSDETCFPAK